MATLDGLTRGRVTLGVGLGGPIDDEYGRFGDTTDPVELAERAMAKMEQPISAHKDGTVTDLSAEVGATVTSGAVICTIADAAE